jgi:3-deoxy-D-manno-octulosonate 8-phosphate phosphatase (KDO 8-P phosphatase)
MQNNTIKLLVLDVDGVQTDGGMFYTESGDRFKKFNSRDGQGIKQALRQGVHVAFLSSSSHQRIISDRAGTLGVKLFHAGPEEKLGVLSGWCKELGVALDEVAYIGDDLNDLACIRAVGISACPADAVDAVKAEVDVVLDRRGGEGCVREFIDSNIMRDID